jgi:hypothetical protein
MKSRIGIGILLISLIVSGCTTTNKVITGTGNLTKEDRAISGVTSVNLAWMGELTILLGDTESLVVEAEANLLPQIITKVENGELTIRTLPNVSIVPTLPVRYTLTVKSLKGIKTSSAGNINGPALQGIDMIMAIASSGNITLKGLTAETLQVEISSNGNLEIGPGQVDSQTISIQSSGNFLAPDLKSRLADCKISSSGNATIWVTEQLTANITSSGNVNYYGNPSTKVETSSSGGVTSLGKK